MEMTRGSGRCLVSRVGRGRGGSEGGGGGGLPMGMGRNWSGTGAKGLKAAPAMPGASRVTWAGLAGPWNMLLGAGWGALAIVDV